MKVDVDPGSVSGQREMGWVGWCVAFVAAFMFAYPLLAGPSVRIWLSIKFPTLLVVGMLSAVWVVRLSKAHLSRPGALDLEPIAANGMIRRVLVMALALLAVGFGIAALPMGDLLRLQVELLLSAVMTFFGYVTLRHLSEAAGFSGAVRWSVWIFCGLFLLSCFTGLDPFSSVNGLVSMRTGFSTLMACVSLFALAHLLSRREEVRRLILKAFWVGSLMVALVAWVQFIWPEGPLLAMVQRVPGDDRPMSTIGHPNWFGTYLCLAIPVSAAIFWTAKTSRSRILAGVAGILLFGALLVCQTRGAWIGMGAFVIWALVAAPVSRRRVLEFLALGLLAAAILLPMRDGTIVHRMGSLGPEVSKAVDGSPAAGTGRFAIWTHGLKVISVNQILWGYGPDCYYFVQDYGDNPPAFKPWKAHSIYIEYAVTIGFAGLAAYLAVLWACARRRDGEPRGDVVLWCLRGAILAYLVQGIFIHDKIVVWPMMWILLGVLAGAGFRQSDTEDETTPVLGPGTLAACRI